MNLLRVESDLLAAENESMTTHIHEYIKYKQSVYYLLYKLSVYNYFI